MPHVHQRRTQLFAACVPVAATAALALALTAGPAHATVARPASVPACSASQLSITLHPLAGSGSAGASVFTLEYANLGSPCTLRGFPGVSAVTSGGRQLGRAASHTRAGERTVMLKAPSKYAYSSATSSLKFTDIENYPASKCTPTIAFGLKVYAPGARTPQIVPAPFPACTSGSAPFLQASPVA